MSTVRKRSRAVLRRVTGVFCGVATTALCVSVAASAFGGVPHVRAAATRTASPFTAPHRSSHPAPHEHGGPIFSAKVDAPGAGPSAEKTSVAQKIAGVAAGGSDARVALGSASLASGHAGGSLLKTDSKCSRTRGQPDAA